MYYTSYCSYLVKKEDTYSDKLYSDIELNESGKVAPSRHILPSLDAEKPRTCLLYSKLSKVAQINNRLP